MICSRREPTTAPIIEPTTRKAARDATTASTRATTTMRSRPDIGPREIGSPPRSPSRRAARDRGMPPRRGPLRLGSQVVTVHFLLPSRGDPPMDGYRASSVITASAQAVWDVLTDVGAWPSWDSGVVRVEGSPALGQKVTVFPEVNPKRGFPVTLVDLRPGAGMTWRGGMPLGLFVGTRTFTLADEAHGRVTFEMQGP